MDTRRALRNDRRVTRVVLVVVFALGACAALPPRTSSSKQATESRESSYRDLGVVRASACTTRPWSTHVRGDCAVAAVAHVTATSVGVDATPAADGNACTTFDSQASSPQDLTIELAEATSVSAIVLVPEQGYDGVTTRAVEASDDGSAWRVLATLSGVTHGGHAYGVAFDRTPARYVRVHTQASASTIAFREVEVISCTGPVRLTGAAVPPPPPPPRPHRRWARGAGTCAHASDCVRDDCCSASTCVARSAAPRCGGISCPDIVDTRDFDCGCREGACGAWIGEGSSDLDLFGCGTE
jgi:hypothetical protein